MVIEEKNVTNVIMIVLKMLVVDVLHKNVMIYTKNVRIFTKNVVW